MDKSDIRKFANRNRAQLSHLDQSFWAREYRRSGSAPALRASGILWQHMKTIRPEWPEPGERERDLESHIAWKELLDRIEYDFPSR